MHLIYARELAGNLSFGASVAAWQIEWRKRHCTGFELFRFAERACFGLESFASSTFFEFPFLTLPLGFATGFHLSCEPLQFGPFTFAPRCFLSCRACLLAHLAASHRALRALNRKLHKRIGPLNAVVCDVVRPGAPVPIAVLMAARRVRVPVCQGNFVAHHDPVQGSALSEAQS